MTRTDRRLLVQEVQELTLMLREDPLLNDLRNLLKQKQLDPNGCLLAGFIESEDGKEFGVIVAPDCTAIEYERVALGNQRPQLIHWSTVQDVKMLADEMFPALIVGIEMARAEQDAAPDQVGD